MENNKLKELLDYLSETHEIIDTGQLNDKHSEVLNNLELGCFENGEAISIVLFHKGMERPKHVHETTKSTFYFIRGSGEVLFPKKTITFKKGTHMSVEGGVPHGFNIFEDTVMLAIQDNEGILKSDGTIDFRYH